MTMRIIVVATLILAACEQSQNAGGTSSGSGSGGNTPLPVANNPADHGTFASLNASAWTCAPLTFVQDPPSNGSAITHDILATADCGANGTVTLSCETSSACSCSAPKAYAYFELSDRSHRQNFVDVANASCGLTLSTRPNMSAKRVFVSATQYDGNLGGLAGADSKCQLAADSKSLGGRWKAWLSDGTSSALERVAGSGPWVQTDRFSVAFANRAALQTLPSEAIFEDEDSAIAPLNRRYGIQSWTNTATGGSAKSLSPSFDCADWTMNSSQDSSVGGTGGPLEGGNQWTDAGTAPCAQANSLICFEQ